MRDVAPVTHLDGEPLHGGEPGPFAGALQQEFSAWADARARDQDHPAAQRAAGMG